MRIKFFYTTKRENQTTRKINGVLLQAWTSTLRTQVTVSPVVTGKRCHVLNNINHQSRGVTIKLANHAFALIVVPLCQSAIVPRGLHVLGARICSREPSVLYNPPTICFPERCLLCNRSSINEFWGNAVSDATDSSRPKYHWLSITRIAPINTDRIATRMITNKISWI